MMNQHVSTASVLDGQPSLFPVREVPIVSPGSISGAPWDRANLIINADALTALTSMPDGLVQTIVTSPPYFRQRDYSSPNQIGSEELVTDYISRLVHIFREARRVLRDDGVLWLNLGDKYFEGALLGLPWRVALALVDDGWVMRSDVIWHKPNAMPHSVKSRPTHDHEYLFMLTKGGEYLYNADAIREPHVTFSAGSKMRGGRNHFGKRGGTPEIGKNAGVQNLHDGRWDQAFHPLGRNKRTVWSVPLSKYRGAHFAVFPENLIRPCILSATNPNLIVLDPFFGSGTTGIVALKAGRRFIGIDINADYCKMAQNRLLT